VKNDVLAQRRDEAAELGENCRLWADLLQRMLDEALSTYHESGPKDAQALVLRQMEDLYRVDYFSIADESRIIRHLREDGRFGEFCDACVSFYGGALELKEIAYRDLGICDPESVAESLGSLNDKLGELFLNVRRAGHTVRVIEPR